MLAWTAERTVMQLCRYRFINWTEPQIYPAWPQTILRPAKYMNIYVNIVYVCAGCWTYRMEYRMWRWCNNNWHCRRDCISLNIRADDVTLQQHYVSCPCSNRHSISIMPICNDATSFVNYPNHLYARLTTSAMLTLKSYGLQRYGSINRTNKICKLCVMLYVAGVTQLQRYRTILDA